ncbi:hypothetical protein [Pseudomonas denitrificans (nom. rej.)]|uniref:Lipoprotein n=1 Tax=Pseudomonas denitrificans TaxID=43306 RepID=A0A9X7N4W6_PSEDE|nr:hypothetical protein [Pseudomonas denitrificans (nom. rej.)]QEY75034.1 hypothetical protein F1C79_27315 [Pseudomonas denitrificans (nom. rej.)]
MNLPRTAILMMSLTTGSGCSVINVYGSGDGVKVSSYYGLPIYSIEPTGATYFDTTGIGFTTTPGGATLGYVKQVYAAVPKDTCTYVIFTQSSQESELLLRKLKELKIDPNKICLTHQGDGSEENPH